LRHLAGWNYLNEPSLLALGSPEPQYFMNHHPHASISGLVLTRQKHAFSGTNACYEYVCACGRLPRGGFPMCVRMWVGNNPAPQARKNKQRQREKRKEKKRKEKKGGGGGGRHVLSGPQVCSGGSAQLRNRERPVRVSWDTEQHGAPHRDAPTSCRPRSARLWNYVHM